LELGEQLPKPLQTQTPSGLVPDVIAIEGVRATITQNLVMASYPRGNRPARPFPYFNEVMTGFEYVAAIGLLYEDELEAGLKCIKAIRDRYDGRKRSPFNEAECGHHYARAMAS
jgi:hypothetical protein